MEKIRPPKRFALTETFNRPGMWTVTDTTTGIGVTFAAHAFRDTQEITLPNGGQGMTADDLDEVRAVLSDITAWMMRFNYDLCAPTIHDERETIARRIAQLREGAGWTRADLSRQAGVSESNIKRIEEAKYSMTYDTMAQLAQAFGMRVDFVAQ